ncbi:TonB-dependent receptor [Chitinophaga tropicalis]|uniref:TonB-dependent receptor plug domain-containing protein n=1 Tax=Chitinophaga tropicalis TaxID=2683588 RepID=A0A7K1U3N1_9BACT|nr:TonB-dependent receptor [Chitinophaga tropicalis]MVT08963.1 TonB-dependent receptor plug domain-containing protein [Chitinophaga tropicalis]
MPQFNKIFILVSLYFCAVLKVYGQQPVLERRITLNVSNESPDAIFDKISSAEKITFAYEVSGLHALPPFSANWKDEKLSVCLTQLLHGSRLTFSANGNTIIIKKKFIAESYTLSGTVRDSANGELLIGVTVLLKDTQAGTRSNAYGYYSLSPGPGRQHIWISCIGYESLDTLINVKANQVMNIYLTPRSTGLGQVIITGYDGGKAKQQAVGAHSLNAREINAIPALLGEADVMKAMQQLPGVQPSVDGLSGLHVRGGGEGQNLILLDEAPIYNAAHAAGFFSIFNPDVVKNADIYMGSIPARYGDRLSSVVDIRLKEGNTERTAVTGSIGTTSSRLMVEGPLKNDKGSWLVAGRYSYAGATLNALHYGLNKMSFLRNFNSYHRGNRISFFDLNVKGNYHLSAKDRLYLSVYTGNDDFYAPDISKAVRESWGNTTATLRWNHIFNARLFSNTSFIYSRYHYNSDLLNTSSGYSWSSGFRKMDLRQHYDYYVNNNHHLEFGFNVGYQRIQTGILRQSSDTFSLATRPVLEPALYISDSWSSHRFSIDYGFRLSFSYNIKGDTGYHWKNRGGEESHMYGGIEPRIAVGYKITSHMSLKLAYAHTRQHMRLLSNSLLSWPSAIWYPSGKDLPVQSADIYSGGFYWSIAGDQLQLAVDAYYKNLYNQAEYHDNANLSSSTNVISELYLGPGRARGLEAMIKKEKGRLSGWISYAWSQTMLKMDEINEGRWYATQYDRPHRISSYIGYKLSERISVSASFNYATGSRITVPAGQFLYNGSLYNYYNLRNSYKLKDFHRLDLSLTVKGKPHRHWQGEWNVSIYNAYNRKNITSIVFTPGGENGSTSPTVYELYIFNLIPSVSYNFKF